jgi:hypothetical protein
VPSLPFRPLVWFLIRIVMNSKPKNKVLNMKLLILTQKSQIQISGETLNISHSLRLSLPNEMATRLLCGE